jgi:phosphoribosylformylglycinamidine synthase
VRQPSVLLLRTAGTNCDEETAFAFERAGARVAPVHVKALCERPGLLNDHAILVLPGGFSYGDDLGSGVVLAHEVAQRLHEPFRRFVERGRLVLGICNGFQVLVKTGLLPGAFPPSASAPNAPDRGPAVGNPQSAIPNPQSPSPNPQSAVPNPQSPIRNPQSPIPNPQSAVPNPQSSLLATLTFNDSQRFEDRWVTLRVEPSASPFLEGAAGRLVTFPVAHGEGKFVTRDPGVLEHLRQARRIAFRYVARDGGPAKYPDNPNGSQDDIAGIVDQSGHVLGLMPHPERHALPWQHPRWTREGLKEEGDGMFVFRNAVKYVRGGEG